MLPAPGQGRSTPNPGKGAPCISTATTSPQGWWTLLGAVVPYCLPLSGHAWSSLQSPGSPSPPPKAGRGRTYCRKSKEGDADEGEGCRQ